MVQLGKCLAMFYTVIIKKKKLMIIVCGEEYCNILVGATTSKLSINKDSSV